MSASQRDISHRVACVCVRVQEGEKERLRRITSKISPAFYAQMSSLSLPLSPPLMWPVLISGADIAAVPSPLVEKDSFSHWERCSWTLDAYTTHICALTHSDTLEHLWTVRGSGANRKWLLLRRGMKRSGCSEEHKAKGNFESGEVPTITFLPFYVLHTHTHTRTHKHTATGTQTHNCLWQEQAALWPLAGSWLRQTLQITDFRTFSLVFSPKE